ncbi:MAG: Ig-like domain-containing protein [Candidatus Shapirobacteria bacterium]|nr:Ig-like domain-containing protein [Candidatus Shapirobacteria bacterium]
MNRLRKFSKVSGFARLVVLVVMLVVAVSMPIAVRLVQQNQENRSSAASGTNSNIKQDKKCKDVGGVCQKKSGSCNGTYLNNYCPSSGTSVKCCVPAKDTAKCLDVGGRCQFTSKTATCSGNVVKSLCSSKTNGGSVVCCVAPDSDSPCTALGGTCVDSSVKTAGGSCAASEGQNGFLDLNRSCKEEGKTCCFPSSWDVDGKCVDYAKKTLTSLPEALCLSGTVSWDGGDMAGSDGKLNWKCKGFNDGKTVNCAAKFKGVRDTDKCLKVGGRCQEKTTACSGGSFRTDKTDLCSGSNASGVGCCVVTGSTNPCTAMKGTCVASASATTSGGGCASSSGDGIFDLTFSCEKNSLCCFSKSININGKCVDYSKVVSAVPEKLCTSGTASWSWSTGKDDDDNDVLAGDRNGIDGALNWKCEGLGEGDDDECMAKMKVDGKCNSEYVGEGKSSVLRPSDALVCSAGKLIEKSGKDGYYTWKCKGLNGGKTVNCKIRRNSCGTYGGTCVDSKDKCTSLGGKESKDETKFCGKLFCCKLPEPTAVPTSSAPTVRPTITPTGVAPTVRPTITPTGVAPTIRPTVTPTGVGVTVLPTSVTLNFTTLELAVGGRQLIGVTVVPTTATNKNVTWETTNASVASVSNTGLVTGVAIGSATITAKTINGKSDTVSVVVKNTITGAPTVAPTGVVPTGDLAEEPKVSFKFSFRGVSPQVSECFDALNDLKVEVMNITSREYESGIEAGFEALVGQTTPIGDQIFRVTDLMLDTDKFSRANAFNYIKIKGPFHVQARMCQNNQSGKLSDTTVCAVKLDGSVVYDFSRYALLSGDINQDGMVNGIDYSELKSNFGQEISCGDDGDLNMDGVVNSIDANLLKDALSTRDDE